MTYRRPALILEGQGDKLAIPRFLREYCIFRGVHDFQPLPRPQQNAEIRKLLRAGEFERFVQYASRYASTEGGDSVLVILDCDDFNPVEIIDQFKNRALCIFGAMPTEIILFKSEFESLFIPCLPRLAEMFPDYDWNPRRIHIDGNCERYRNAKGVISEAMREKAYKETRDQVKFVGGLDYEILRRRSESFQRFEDAFVRFLGPASL